MKNCWKSSCPLMKQGNREGHEFPWPLKKNVGTAALGCPSEQGSALHLFHAATNREGHDFSRAAQIGRTQGFSPWGKRSLPSGREPANTLPAAEILVAVPTVTIYG